MPFCSLCGAPFEQQQQQVPPRFQEQMTFEERDHKSLLYQQQPSSSATPVVYVDEHETADSTNGRNLSSVSSNGQNTSNGGRVLSSRSSGILKGRYSDHPNCDICSLAFDVTKCRHQCRSCGRFVCGTYPGRRPDRRRQGLRSVHPPASVLALRTSVAASAGGSGDSIRQGQSRDGAARCQVADARAVLTLAGKGVHERSRYHWQLLPGRLGHFRGQSHPHLDAHGLAIMTIIKAGFLLVGKVGTGIVVSRLPDGSWSAPSAIGTVGLGSGFEIGGEIVEVMTLEFKKLAIPANAPPFACVLQDTLDYHAHLDWVPHVLGR